MNRSLKGILKEKSFYAFESKQCSYTEASNFCYNYFEGLSQKQK